MMAGQTNTDSLVDKGEREIQKMHEEQTLYIRASHIPHTSGEIVVQ
jgi:hypothetical protein